MQEEKCPHVEVQKSLIWDSVDKPRAARARRPAGSSAAGWGRWKSCCPQVREGSHEVLCELWPCPAATQWAEPAVHSFLGALISPQQHISTRGAAEPQPWHESRAPKAVAAWLN